MEKTPEFLKSRTAYQLSQVVETLASNVCLEVANLQPITPDSDLTSVVKHDCGCIFIISLCDSLTSVVNELKSLFE